MPASQKCNAVTGIRAAGPPSGGSHGKAGGKGSPLQGEYRMSINIGPPQFDELKPRIAVIGVGGAGGNAIANMIAARVAGVDFVVANTDAQALNASPDERRIQLRTQFSQGLGAGSRPEIGRAHV